MQKGFKNIPSCLLIKQNILEGLRKYYVYHIKEARMPYLIMDIIDDTLVI